MSVKENVELVRRMEEEIVGGHNIEALDEVLHEDYQLRSGSDSSWSTEIRGIEEMKKVFRDILKDHPTWKVTVDDAFGEGDKVAVRMTFLEEGKPQTNAIAIYRLSDGKIIDDWYCSRSLE